MNQFNIGNENPHYLAIVADLTIDGQYTDIKVFPLLFGPWKPDFYWRKNPNAWGMPEDARMLMPLPVTYFIFPHQSGSMR